MRYFLRKRGLFLVALSLGSCFALTNCADTAQMTLLQIGFTSFTLPINQALINLFNLISASITGAAAAAS